MFHKNALCSSLTRFVALALSGGVFLVPSSPVLAADVTIDSAHPPIKNVTVPERGSVAAVGTDAEHASDSTLTVTQYQDDNLRVYGGLTLGAGDAMNNIVRIKGTATEIASVYGGAA